MRPRLALALLVALGVACGQPGQPQRQQTVRVGIQDQGKTVELNAGDRLLISLGEESTGAYRWELTGYPAGTLEVMSTDEDAARFELLAAGEGDGSVRLTGRPRCGRDVTGSDDDVQCPVLGAGAGGAPLRLFVITVSVSAA